MRFLRLAVLAGCWCFYLLAINFLRLRGVAFTVAASTGAAALFFLLSRLLFDPSAIGLRRVAEFRLGTLFSLPLLALLGSRLFLLCHDIATGPLNGALDKRALILGLALFAQLVLIYVTFVRMASAPGESWHTPLGVMALGIAGWAGINILLIRSGFTGAEAIYSEATFGGMDGYRFSAPLGPVGNHFGTVSALGAVGGAIAAWRRFQDRRWIEAGLLMATIPVALYVLRITETRSAILMVASTLGALTLGSFKRTAKLLQYAICAFPLVWMATPWVAVAMVANGWIDRFAPDALLKLGRSSDEMLMFGNRFYIFDYGLQQIYNGEVPLLGLGLNETDASPALSYTYGGTSQMFAVTYHCYFLHAAIQYGLPVAILLIAMHIWITRRSLAAGAPSKDSIDLGLAALFAAIYSAQIFDVVTKLQEGMPFLLVALLPLALARSIPVVKSARPVKNLPPDYSRLPAGARAA